MRKPLPPQVDIDKLPPDGGPDFNRLVFSQSPYLLQHARNPVDWHPWGPEAFAKARKEDKPVFLSVGYSTCHWCHVMERESFESRAVASALNEHYVAVKVDREERPDVDDVYMKVTQLMTGSGGWPNSLWLTAEGKPWLAGTYFPPEDRDGRLGFRSVLLRFADVWKTRRGEVVDQADRIAAVLAEHFGSIAGEKALSRALVDQAVELMLARFDREQGGFEGAPKFPPHNGLNLALLILETEKSERLLRFVTATLKGMGRGGLRDHLGGGFHRYATDERWFLPHFEKMLYDNALLARAYADAWRLTGNDAFRTVAMEALQWALRVMEDEQGGFHSALDADSEGEEGRFYLWTPDQVKDVLGEADGAFFSARYGIVEGGNFHDEATGRKTGGSIPFLPGEVGDDEARLAPLRLHLRQARDRRPWPFRDDKILTAWNGLMVGALARAGRIFGEKTCLEAADRAAHRLLAVRDGGGRLHRVLRRGRATVPAFLDDYAFLAEGLLELHEATDESRWLDEARKLGEVLVADFYDPRQGGFFFTSKAHEALLLRGADPYDSATPSANAVASEVLLRLHARMPGSSFREKALKTLRRFAGVLEEMPLGMLRMARAVRLALKEEQDR